MLLVSALVTVGVFFQESNRLQRALAELEIVISLMAHWHAETISESTYPLTRILAGVAASDPDKHATFKLHLVPFNKLSREEIYSGRCTVTLDLTQYLFVNKDGKTEYIAIQHNNNGTQEILVQSFYHEKRLWQPVEETPTNLLGFSKLWDKLVASGKAARIVSIDPDAGTSVRTVLVVIEKAKPIPYFGPRLFRSTEKEVYYEVKESNNFAANSSVALMIPMHYEVKESSLVAIVQESHNPLNISILPLHDYADAQLNGRTLRDVANLEGKYGKYADAILDSWEGRDINALTAWKCFDDEKQHEYDVEIPVKLEYQNFDWVQNWVDQVIQTKRLAPGTIADSRPFAEAFADLDQESKGLESLAFKELQDWMNLRIDREGEAITILGISVPPHLLRLFGIFFIIVVQAYATLHLAEAAVRMERSTQGDLGAFKPWVMLYNNAAAKCATFVVIFTPPLAALTLVIRLTVDELSGWISIFGAILSLILSIFALNNARRLRLAAQSHRQALVETA